MKYMLCGIVFFLGLSPHSGTNSVNAEQRGPVHVLIHMKTALAEDDAQICAVPNVAWAAVKAGHKVTILVDASAVTSVTKGYGWLNGMLRPGTTALDRATLPERARRSLAEQMDVALEEIPRDYGDYFDHLRELGVHIFANRTMMLLYEIDPLRLPAAVNPISLQEMVALFERADRIIVY